MKQPQGGEHQQSCLINPWNTVRIDGELVESDRQLLKGEILFCSHEVLLRPLAEIEMEKYDPFMR